MLDVQVKWRDPAGQFQQTTLKLAPGWHTVLLGNSQTKQVASIK